MQCLILICWKNGHIRVRENDVLQHAWISESISYWNDVKGGGKEYSSCEAERLIGKFMEILTKAGEEYEYEPPSKYNREGYNTYKRMA